MAFCTKCGKQLADGEVCACSTPAATPASAPQAQQVAAPKKKKKPMAIVIIIAVLAIAITILVLIFTANPHMKPVKDFMSAVNKQTTDNVQLYQTLMPDFAAKELGKLYKQMSKSEDYAEFFENSSDGLASNYEFIADEYGDWKLSFELKKETLLDDDEFDNIKDNIEDYYRNYLDYDVEYYEDILEDDESLEDYADDLDISEKQAKALIEAIIAYNEVYKDVEVTEVYEIKGKFIIKADGEKYDTDTVKFYLAKVNGDWTYYSFIDGNLSFDGDDYNSFYFIRNFIQTGRYYVNIL